MAVKSTMKNMFLCLMVVCLVCSALLGGAYALTKDSIDAANLANKNAAIARVVPEFDNVPSEEAFSVELAGKEYEVYPAMKEGKVVAYAINSSAIGFSGAVVVMVGITSDGIVYNTAPISHAETPGLGAKISENGNTFTPQFENFNPSEKILKVKKDGGDIDAITASTITSRAYVSAVETALQVFSKINSEL